MSSDFKIKNNNLNHKYNKKFDIYSHNTHIQSLLNLNLERQQDITLIRSYLEKKQKIKWDYNSVSSFVSKYDDKEDQRILEETKIVNYFNNVFYTQDVHMKNIDKICRKITKIYTSDRNEISVITQVQSSAHLYYIMDQEPIKHSTVKEKINIADLVSAQITNLITDYQVDVHLLLLIICDYVRKVYANEFLRFFNAIEEAVMSDLISPSELKHINPILSKIKLKYSNILYLYRSINKAFIHLDLRVEKMHKFLMEANLKTKSSVTKYSYEFNTRNMITEESVYSQNLLRKNNGIKDKGSKSNYRKVPKPLIVRLDYNNKIEAVPYSSLIYNKKSENKCYKPSLNEVKEIQKMFQIDEFTFKLENMKSIINTILSSGRSTLPTLSDVSEKYNNNSCNLKDGYDSIETSILTQMLNNSTQFNDIFKYIDKGWRREKLSKICFKIRTVTKIRKIQRGWRLYKFKQYNKYAYMIQQFFKKVVVKCNLIKMPTIKKLFNLRRTFSKLKIDNALKLYAKKFRINKCYNKLTSVQRNSLQDYSNNHLHQIVIIQKYARSYIAYKTVIQPRIISTHNQALKKKQKMKDMYFSYTLSNQYFESQYISREIVCKWELWNLEDYIEKQLENYDTNWDSYERQLKEYLNKHIEMKDWIQQTNSLGVKYWINIKTLKDQREHPSVKVFRTNKKLLKDKADQEMGYYMQTYTTFKEILEEFSDINYKEYSNVINDNKANFIKNIL